MLQDDAANVRLPRNVKGKRSQFYNDPAVDQLMTYFLEMMAEFSSMRERFDTVERLLEEKGSIRQADIQNYIAPPSVEAERSAWAVAFVERVLRQHK